MGKTPPTSGHPWWWESNPTPFLFLLGFTRPSIKALLVCRTQSSSLTIYQDVGLVILGAEREVLC